MSANQKLKIKSWFECINGCEKYGLDEIVYKCGKCGSLLEVKQDINSLKKKTGANWKKTFDERMGTTIWPYGSGVWNKKEFVLPEIDDANIISMYEGNTNLFWAKKLGGIIGVEDLWIKLCGNTHTGSFKDLGMTVLISQVNQMISDGKKILAVACASTGDTSAALAAYAAAADIPAIVFLPRGKISNAQLIQPIANGAITLAIDSDFDGCMKIVQDITAKHNIYLANSMNSLRVEGQKTISVEILQQFNWEVPDFIIIPGGNLGNVSALGKGFDLMMELGMINKTPRIVVAQAKQANPLYLSYLNRFKKYDSIAAKPTAASAIQIGNPVSVEKAIKILKKYNGIVEQASEDELSNACAIGDLTGLYNCPHTGVALSALFKLVKNKTIKKNHKVVVISTAHGLKFSEFKINYHEKKLKGVKSRFSNLPIVAKPSASEVEKIIFKQLDKKMKSEKVCF
ncbi:MAG TPA: threonine synthase [bacterium]|nr:threonine synthase [bacterium]HPN32082.1 threonine synthase [bacterium]